MSNGASRRGIQRERDLVNWFRENDWFSMRAPASLGSVDVIAMKRGERTRFCEVKSTTAGAFHSFGPKDREALAFMADLADADPYLVWWPKRSKPVWIGRDEWP